MEGLFGVISSTAGSRRPLFIGLSAVAVIVMGDGKGTEIQNKNKIEKEIK